MTNEEAIRHLETQLDPNYPARLEALRLAIAALERERWISVEEQLPGPFEIAIISIATTNGYSEPVTLETIGAYDHRTGCWESFTAQNKQLCPGERVTHWRPFPERIGTH